MMVGHCDAATGDPMSEAALLHDGLGIFLSYSRRDLAAADRLVAALEGAGFTVTIDRRDLPYGEEWQAELADLIRASDTVVWLVSPASVGSRWCNWELGEVQRINKRLIPVAIAAVAPDALPEGLGRIHVLPAEGAFDFQRDLPRLVEALNTDRAWLKEHTRLADRARQWLARDRSAALLLRGVALKDAQAWADSKPPAAPAPSDDILQLLMASGVAQSRRQRMTVMGSIVAAVVGLGLAGVATWQWREADAQRAEAERNFETARTTVFSLVDEIGRGLTAERVRTEFARHVFEVAAIAVEKLQAVAPDDRELLRGRAMMLEGFANNYGSIGDMAGAISTRKEISSILEQLAAAEPEDSDLQTDRIINFLAIGNGAGLQGDQRLAVQAFTDGAQLAQELREQGLPAVLGNISFEIYEAEFLGRMGAAQATMGDLAAALAAHNAELQRLQHSAAIEPGNRYVQRRILQAYRAVAAITARQSEEAEGTKHYGVAIDRARAAASEYPELESEVAYGLRALGAFLANRGNRPLALTNFEMALSIDQRLAAQEPSDYSWLLQLANANAEIGELQFESGNLDGALESYRKALELNERYADSPMEIGPVFADDGWYRVAQRHARIGALLELRDGPAQALASYDEEHRILRRLVALDSEIGVWQEALQDNRIRTGESLTKLGDTAAAHESFEQGLAVARALVEQAPESMPRQASLVRSLVKVASTSERADAEQRLMEARALFKHLEEQDQGGAVVGLLADLSTELSPGWAPPAP